VVASQIKLSDEVSLVSKGTPEIVGAGAANPDGTSIRQTVSEANSKSKVL
jgi:hypothetical protein